MLAIVGTFLLVLATLVSVCYLTAPTHNTDTQHFDAILVLGTPALRQGGGISQAGKWLMEEAAREYRAGRAQHIVVSGGAVANRFTEADVLARYARELGIPDTAVLEERQARNTLQNVQKSASIVQEHGWQSVEVIGLKEHLPRAAILLKTTALKWRTHAAPTPGRRRWNKISRTLEEAVGTTVLRLFGVWTATVLHGVKVVMGLPGALIRYIRGIP